MYWICGPCRIIDTISASGTRIIAVAPLSIYAVGAVYSRHMTVGYRIAHGQGLNLKKAHNLLAGIE